MFGLYQARTALRGDQPCVVVEGNFDVMSLHSATSAILSSVIFNAIIIPLLIPIALKGVEYRPVGADALLRRNLLVWGLGGVIVPFVGIKLIDLSLVALNLVS